VFPIEPDLAIAIDTAVCGDVPSVSKKESEIALLRGPAISLIQAGGSGAILPESLRKYITGIASKNKIKYQFEMIDSGMTEAAIVQMLKDGILCCSIGIPIRNTHTPFEIFDSRDVDETLKLVELIEEEWK
jgi:endoglucanase